MAEVKTITINGKTYTVDDPDSVSFGKTQDLSKEKKTIARKNIGAANIDDTNVGADAWSSKNIVDRLCPSFAEIGAMVACEPVEGYPLEVISEIPYEKGVAMVCHLVTYDPDTGEYTETSEIIDDPDPFAEGADRYDDVWTTSGVPVYACDGTFYTRMEEALYELESLTLTRYGKNLLGYNDFSVGATNRTLSCTDGVCKVFCEKVVYSDWVFTTDTNSSLKNNTLKPGTYVFSLNQLSGPTLADAYARVFLEDGTIVNLLDGQAVTLTQKGTVSGIKLNQGRDFTKNTEITFTLQIEVGGVATEYESYREEKYTVDFGGHNNNIIYGSYNWTTGVLIDADNDYQEVQFEPQPMLAYEGVNTFISSTGNTTVKGKKDPVALINKLEATVNALLGG